MQSGPCSIQLPGDAKVQAQSGVVKAGRAENNLKWHFHTQIPPAHNSASRGPSFTYAVWLIHCPATGRCEWLSSKWCSKGCEGGKGCSNSILTHKSQRPTTAPPGAHHSPMQLGQCSIHLPGDAKFQGPSVEMQNSKVQVVL